MYTAQQTKNTFILITGRAPYVQPRRTPSAEVHGYGCERFLFTVCVCVCDDGPCQCMAGRHLSATSRNSFCPCSPALAGAVSRSGLSRDEAHGRTPGATHPSGPWHARQQGMTELCHLAVPVFMAQHAVCGAQSWEALDSCMYAPVSPRRRGSGWQTLVCHLSPLHSSSRYNKVG